MKTILAALDSDPMAPAVLQAAVEATGAQTDRLVVMRACLVPARLWLVPGPQESASHCTPTERALTEARNELQPLLQQLPRGMPAKLELRLGEAGEQICSAGRELGAHLIVLGAHSLRSEEGILGTTAIEVLSRADCSVLVVRQSSPALEGRA